MLKKELQKEYDKLVELHKNLVKENVELEAKLTIEKTWVEIGDKKLEKAMVKIDKLLEFKHKHQNGNK